MVFVIPGCSQIRTDVLFSLLISDNGLMLVLSYVLIALSLKTYNRSFNIMYIRGVTSIEGCVRLHRGEKQSLYRGKRDIFEY